jgi:hypothetical protein
MEIEQTFTLRFWRNDGGCEPAKLSRRSLDQVREFARLVFERSGRLYSKVEIVRSGRRLETIRNPQAGSRPAC